MRKPRAAARATSSNISASKWTLTGGATSAMRATRSMNGRTSRLRARGGASLLGLRSQRWCVRDDGAVLATPEAIAIPREDSIATIREGTEGRQPPEQAEQPAEGKNREQLSGRSGSTPRAPVGRDHVHRFVERLARDPREARRRGIVL